jgi:hypothetical protein
MDTFQEHAQAMCNDRWLSSCLGAIDDSGDSMS